MEERFEKLYLLFRANYYKRIIESIGIREGSLSATEAFCVELIYLLGNPTITRFAEFFGISLPNAHYKVGSLIKKGYVVKEASKEDQRESYLYVTEKFLNYYGLNNEDNARLMRRIRETFSEGELEQLENTIDRILLLMQEEVAP